LVEPSFVCAANARNANGKWFLPGAGRTEWFKDHEASPEMVVVPAGSFKMGSPDDEVDREMGCVGAESPPARGDHSTAVCGQAISCKAILLGKRNQDEGTFVTLRGCCPPVTTARREAS
jgi:hypothetical protein